MFREKFWGLFGKKEQRPDQFKVKSEEKKEPISPEISPEESKEKEKLSPIMLIYRNNDLYEKYIPEVKKTLESLGRRVEVQAFSKTTPAEEINEWTKHNEEKLKDKCIIPDMTSYQAKYKTEYETEIDFSKDSEGNVVAGSKDTLDGFFENATIRTIEEVLKFSKRELIKKLRSKGEGEEYKDELYPILIKQILKNKKNVPHKVYILTGNLRHHELEEKSEGEVIDIYKKCFKSGGIPEENIEVIKSGSALTRTEHETTALRRFLEQIGKNNWVFMDRHQMRGIYDLPDRKFVFLPKPLSNFVKSAAEEGLLENIDFEKVMEKNIKKILEEKFKSA